MFKNQKEVNEAMKSNSHLIVKSWFFNKEKLVKFNEMKKFIEKETDKALLLSNSLEKDAIKIWIPKSQIVSYKYVGIMEIEKFVSAEEKEWVSQK